LKCVTEANLTLPELAAVALDIRTVCQLPIVLDAGGGWGDPVHVHRTKPVLHMERGKILNPKQTPDSAKPIVAAAFRLRLRLR
jgi:hypothetical protein